MKTLTAIHRLDLQLLARIFSQGERRRVRPLALALSRSGDGYLHLLIPALLWQLESALLTPFITVLGLALVVERCLYWCLKNSLKRRRPQEAVPGFRSLVVAADQFSFPSGHSSAAFLLATTLVLIYGGPVVMMFLWAGGVALSRVLLGVHFPGDTVAGGLMGASIAVLCASVTGLA
jgi:undecaprenyl-diphosphatase